MQKLIITEENLIKFYDSEIRNLKYEELRIPFLDSEKRWIMGEFKKNIGRKDTTGEISLNIVLREAIISKGECMYIFHNHPKGENALPSKNDIRLTSALELAGYLIEIPLIDSIVISENGNYSFRKEDQLWNFFE